jgi:uncharacterized UPF0160 family protein
MNINFKRIITHSGTHHADEILAIATIFEFVGELPVERKNKAEKEDLECPETLVLDIGGHLEPGKGNFDHHQDSSIPATNMLVLNHFCNDEKIKVFLHKNLFAYVDAVDRGIAPVRIGDEFLPPDFNSVIRWMNNLENGFDKALNTARYILSAAIATARQSIKGEAVWNSLEKHGKIAIQHTADPVVGWHELAERDGILLLITPNNRIPGSYQLMSRDTKLLVIPETEGQMYKHPSGFLAVYPSFAMAMEHAVEILKTEEL